MDTPGLYSFIDTLTKQHDQLSMVRCFLDFLTKEFSAQDAFYYEIHSHDLKNNEKNNNEKQEFPKLFNPLTNINIVQEFDSQLLDVYKSREMFMGDTSETGHRRCIYPVVVGLQVFGLIDFKIPVHENKVMEQLGFLTRLFGNLFILIYKKERDGLTGLLHRLDFENRIHRIINHNFGKERRAGTPDDLCIAIADIDYFKKVNDEFGHLFGDEVLVHLSQLMNRSFRDQDLICRYGGEEFAIAINGVGIKPAVQILERFVKAVQAYRVPQVGSVTMSIGVVQVTKKELLTNIIDKADKALYFAKENGRNQVQAYETLLAENKLPDVSARSGDIELF